MIAPTIFVCVFVCAKFVDSPLGCGHMSNQCMQVQELSAREKAVRSREQSRATAFAKDAKGSAAISSFFKKSNT